jgi:hypothetical protein
LTQELEREQRTLRMERDELQAALEEAESVVEMEGQRAARLQLELAQARQDVERRVGEKQEEFESIR